MLTTTPHLRIRRPSPTTAEFTVTTRPTLKLPLRLLLFSVFLLRFAIGVAIISLLWSKWSLTSFATPPRRYAATPPLFSSDFIWYAVYASQKSAVGELFLRLAKRIPTQILLPASLAFVYAILLRIHTTDSLLVLRGLGIQTSSTGGTYLTSAVTRFIPTEKIQDIFINEAFRGFEVRYYLVVVVEGEEDVVVVFPQLLPKRKIVEAVWRGVRGCLYEADGVRNIDDKG
jgi:phosphatidylinositol N-acetylglucosaminyltransferase subunit H